MTNETPRLTKQEQESLVALGGALKNLELMLVLAQRGYSELNKEILVSKGVDPNKIYDINDDRKLIERKENVKNVITTEEVEKAELPKEK